MGPQLLTFGSEFQSHHHACPRVSRATRSAKVLVEIFIWNHSCNDPESWWRMSQTSLNKNWIGLITKFDEKSAILFSRPTRSAKVWIEKIILHSFFNYLKSWWRMSQTSLNKNWSYFIHIIADPRVCFKIHFNLLKFF